MAVKIAFRVNWGGGNWQEKKVIIDLDRYIAFGLADPMELPQAKAAWQLNLGRDYELHLALAR
jgi:hypothetical protein